VLETLEAVDYDGWLMVEQDSSWLPPAEAAAVGRRVLGYALRELDR
jgi:sugar phosphate isomerase/epimerase